jgi:hypothetical protein
MLRDRYGDAVASTLLTELLVGVSPGVAVTEPYAHVLRTIGGVHAAAVLSRWGRDPEASGLDHWTRAWAARAFAYLGDPTAGPALADALEDDHWWVRKTAAQTLGRLRLTAFETDLRHALRDPHKRVRRTAVAALGRVGSVGSMEALRRLLDDEDREVRGEADKALSALGARAAAEDVVAGRDLSDDH